MPIVELENLTKDYPIGAFHQRRRRALDRLTLAVDEGEVFGLVGPNGAGKTTALKLLFGLIFPTAGRARILGRPVGDLAVRAQVGFLPESPYFYDYLTGRELLDYFGRLLGLPAAARRPRVEAVLAQVGLTDGAGLELRRYSKGMLQRLGVAQAILNRPRLVFFDEPMSGLDPLGRREMAQLIRGLHRDGVTVFFSSHILSDVEALCDRIAILNRGRLVRAGRLEEIHDGRVRAIELVVEPLPEAVRPALEGWARRIETTDGRGRLELARVEDVDRAIDLVRAAGARIVSVTPLRPSLEEVFVQAIEAADRERG